jgi:hypothetical protein
VTFISYIIVLVGGPIVLTISTLLLGFFFALLLTWASMRFRMIFAGFTSGVLGAICAWLFGNWIFAHVGHESWASLHPSIATSLAIAIPFFNDLNHAKKIKEVANKLPASLDEAHAQATTLYAQLVGYMIGVVLAFGLLASRVAA